ncbi:hypothetical protein ACFVFQ_21780 [Streptomyces sp. NPDC057743]
MLTSGGNALPLYQETIGGLLENLAGVHLPEPHRPPLTPNR